jgi:NAD(P)-dependent dehydrogenase (short-subunit alcohol dehydrogenase family)
LLEERVAVLTGAGQGIGHAIASALGRHGAKGMILDLESSNGSSEPPEGFETVPADVTVEEDLAGAFVQARERYGGIDIVVANAGIVPPWREAGALDLAEWTRVFAVNVAGVAATIKHGAAAMWDRGGAIIVTASVNALKAPPGQMAYTTSKTALIGLVRTAAHDLGPKGIRVNAVAPGAVMTDALRQRIADRAADGGPPHGLVETTLRETSPLKQIVTEDDVAHAALFLVSDWSRQITGHVLPVDAGLSVT